MSKIIVVKRDGKIESFDPNKILNAVRKACNDGAVDIDNSYQLMSDILGDLYNGEGEYITVEDIHELVINKLMEADQKVVANNYREYRNERNRTREKKSKIMKTINELAKETDRDNGNVGNNFSAKLLRIASEANKWTVSAEMDKEMAKLHENGFYHIHDMDSFNLTVNCLHVPTGKMLREGFNTGYGTLRSPKRIESAAALSCILLQSTQNK